MPILVNEESDVKLMKERRKTERPGVLKAERQSYNARCMFSGCEWYEGGFSSLNEAEKHARDHSERTGHPVNLRGVIEVNCGVVRSRLFGGR